MRWVSHYIGQAIHRFSREHLQSMCQLHVSVTLLPPLEKRSSRPRRLQVQRLNSPGSISFLTSSRTYNLCATVQYLCVSEKEVCNQNETKRLLEWSQSDFNASTFVLRLKENLSETSVLRY